MFTHDHQTANGQEERLVPAEGGHATTEVADQITVSPIHITRSHATVAGRA